MAITLDALEALDAIDRRGSFAAAAAALGKVPSALTYTVRKLEDELDVLVYDRRGHRALLTPAGREVLEAGRLILQSTQDLVHRAQRVAKGWEPELRIATDAVIDPSALRPLIRDFLDSGAPTRLRLSEEVLDGCWEALAEGRADLIIGAAHDAPARVLASSRFSLRPLGRCRFMFCVSPMHPLAAASTPIEPQTLREYRAIVVSDSARAPSLRHMGVTEGQPTLTVGSMAHKLQLQCAGLGVGWLPEAIARPAIERGELVVREVAEPRSEVTLHYGWPRGASGQALKWWLSRLGQERVRTQLLQSAPARHARTRSATSSTIASTRI
jgi:DNA-binding transcriptional LysR family regulator